MQIGWEKAEYEIQMHQAGRIYSETVYGFAKGGFGIHETDSGWNITHIASGWNCMTAESENGAVIIAHHLMTDYYNDFNRLKVSGTELENFKPLLEKIKSDAHLAELKRLFTDQSSRKKDGQREIELKIIS